MISAAYIPTTGRKDVFLAKQLGFSSVKAFAVSLAKGAVVADVGAGVSQFGHSVTQLRPDVVWVNIDPCYADQKILQAASTNAPDSLRFFADDIVKGFKRPKELENGADLVFSYWLLPHLSVEDDQVAAKAVGEMYDLLKPGGTLAIGPVRTPGVGLFSPFRYKATARFTTKISRQQVVQSVVEQTKLWWLPRTIQRLANKHNIHLAMFFVGGKTKSNK